MLDRGGSEIVAQTAQNVLTRSAAIAGYAHLDEFVGAQAAVDFRGHGRSQAVAADPNGRLELVSPRTQGALVGGRQLQWHGKLLGAAFRQPAF